MPFDFWFCPLEGATVIQRKSDTEIHQSPLRIFCNSVFLKGAGVSEQR